MPAYQSGWQGISEGIKDIGNFQAVASKMREQDQAVQTNQMQQAVHAVNLQKEQNALKLQEEEQKKNDEIADLRLNDIFSKVDPKTQEGLTSYLSSQGAIDSGTLMGKRGNINKGIKAWEQDPIAFSRDMQHTVASYQKKAIEADDAYKALLEKKQAGEQIDPEKLQQAKVAKDSLSAAYENTFNQVNSHTTKLRQQEELYKAKAEIEKEKNRAALNRNLASPQARGKFGDKWGYMQINELGMPEFIEDKGVPKSVVETGMKTDSAEKRTDAQVEGRLAVKKIGGTGGGKPKATKVDWFTTDDPKKPDLFINTSDPDYEAKAENATKVLGYHKGTKKSNPLAPMMEKISEGLNPEQKEKQKQEGIVRGKEYIMGGKSYPIDANGEVTINGKRYKVKTQ